MDKAHAFERICSETQFRRILNLGKKCSDDFEPLTNVDSNSINLRRKSTGEIFSEEKFCLDIAENQLKAEICRDVGNRSPTA